VLVKSDDRVLQALLRKRVEIYTWLESPMKQAHLAKINRMIEERRDFLASRLGHPRAFTPEATTR
jgi:hypothetical protein